MRTDFILDFETMGQNALEVPIIDCAYTTFTWERFLDNPYSFEELAEIIHHNKLDVKEQVDNYGAKFKKRDLEWWQSQGKEARSKIAPKPDDMSASEFVNTLFEYLSDHKVSYWWSRSNTFDPIILQRYTVALNRDDEMNKHLKFWKVRDIRTFVDAKFNFTTRNGFVPISDEHYWNQNFNQHDSKHDVAADILRLQAIHRAENDLEQVER